MVMHNYSLYTRSIQNCTTAANIGIHEKVL